MRQLSLYRWYLLFWAVVCALYVVHVNWYGGRDEAFRHWWDVTHFTWISVPESIVLVVPALAFNLATVRRYGGVSSQLGRAILFLTLGVVSWGVVGNAIFFVSQLVHDGATPDYPWWPDLGYVGLLPFYFLGLHAMSKVLGMQRRDYLRLSWLPIVAAAFTWYLTLPTGGIGPEWVLGTWSKFAAQPTFGPFNANMASFGYLLSDVVVASWALMLLARVRDVAGGMFHGAVQSVVTSLVFLYLADLFFDQRIKAGTYFVGDVATICYAISLYTMMYATLRFAEVERELSSSLLAPLERETRAEDHSLAADGGTQ